MKKVLVSLDDDLLREIDAAAAKAGTSRSAWLAAQAEHGLGGPAPSREERTRAALAEIRRIVADAPPFYGPFLPAAEEVRRLRDERSARRTRPAAARSEAVR